MIRFRIIGLTLAAVLLGIAPGEASVHHRHRAHAARPQARHVARRYAGLGYARPYASPVSPTITCRYRDGTPFDPDIIGGPNHVGDGGPAANLGGFSPCGY